MFHSNRIYGRLAVALTMLLLGGAEVCDARGKPPVPDLTKGGTKDDKRARMTACLKILRSYGGAAKAVLPQLRVFEQKLKNHREARSMKTHIAMVSKLIADVEAANDTPVLRSLNLPEGKGGDK